MRVFYGALLCFTFFFLFDFANLVLLRACTPKLFGRGGYAYFFIAGFLFVVLFSKSSDCDRFRVLIFFLRFGILFPFIFDYNKWVMFQSRSNLLLNFSDYSPHTYGNMMKRRTQMFKILLPIIFIRIRQ